MTLIKPCLHRVRVKETARFRFPCEPNETVLDAAPAAGY